MSVIPTGSTGADALTVDSAAQSVFGTLLSQEEDGEDRETPQAEAEQAEAPQADESGDPEQQPEGEAEQTDEPQPEEPPSEEPEAPQYDPTAKFKVKVDGEEVEVTLDEMAKGYSRTADYTRKMQALAETRKASESEIVSARQERAALAENLKLLEAAIAEVSPKEPDWDKLRVEHPDQFPTVWAQWQQGQKERAQVTEMRVQAERKVMEDQFHARQERIKVEQEKLMTAIPSWKDEKVMKAEKDEMVKFVEARGFTVDDLRAIEDHRHLALIRDAMLYNKSQEKKPAIIRQIEKVRTTKPSNQTMTRSTPTALQKSLERLAKDRTQEAAVSVFRHVIDD